MAQKEEAVREEAGGDGGGEEGLVKRRRVVVRTIRVKKEDVPKLMGAVRGEPLPAMSYDEVPEVEVVLAGPRVTEQTLESRVVKCRLLRPPVAADLPEAITSHKRPVKKATALLWSRQRFLRRLYEIKKKGQKH